MDNYLSPEYINPFNTIDILTMESELNVLHRITESYFKELDMMCNSNYYMEAFNIKTFFKKAIDLLKRFFSWIGRGIKKIIDFLFKRKPKASADQILDKYINNNNVNESYVQEMTREQADSVTVHFPAAEGSVLSETDIKLITKKLLIKIENDEFDISPSYGINLSDEYHMAGPRMTDASNYSFACAYINNHNGFHTWLQETCNMLKNNDIMEFIKSSSKAHAYFDEISNRESRWNLTIQQLRDAQRDINNISIAISNVEVETFTGNNNLTQKQINDVKWMISIAERMTYGMNMLMRDISSVYSIDAKYRGKINDIDTLSKVVEAFIKDGIPSKYVAYNVWCLLADKMKTDDGVFVAMDTSPKWGQTRVTFLPKDKPTNVLKVAMNGAGVMGIRKEQQIFNVYDKAGIDILAPIKHVTSNGCVAVFERMKSILPQYENEIIQRCKEYINDAIIKGLPSIHDIHRNNVGMPADQDGSDGNFDYYIIDYGNATITGNTSYKTYSSQNS